jgi:hypothetical protein
MNKKGAVLTSVILLFINLGIIGLTQPQEAEAEGEFIVRVYATDVTLEKGLYRVTVTAADGTTKSIVHNPRGYTGTVPPTIFTFDASATKTGELFDVCLTSVKYKGAETCAVGENTPKKAPEDIHIQAPGPIVEYNDDGGVTTSYPFYDDVYPHVPEDDTFEDDE